MNKVVTINLGGAAYQLEEGGYDALRAYLETATARLQSNPDRDEILSDIERAIAEKFRAHLGGYKSVISEQEVAAALAELGPVEADSGEAAKPGEGGAGDTGGHGAAGEERAAGHDALPRRLYRIDEDSMLAGVCNGIAAYLKIDPTLVRLAFVLLTLVWGFGLVVYIVLAIVMPEARSPEEKAAASGSPSTAQEFIKRAKAGYYEAMKDFPDRKARRAWRRRFRQEMRGWRLAFKREMREKSEPYQYHWQGWRPEHVSVHPGMGFTLPVLSVLHGAATLLWFCAMISLLATGGVLGMALPVNVPVWVAALLLCVAYGILVSPLKLARRACYAGFGLPRAAWSFVFLLDAMIWFAVIVVLLWLAVHYFPELREAVRSIPAQAHQAVNDIRTWWNGR